LGALAGKGTLPAGATKNLGALVSSGSLNGALSTGALGVGTTPMEAAGNGALAGVGITPMDRPSWEQSLERTDPWVRMGQLHLAPKEPKERLLRMPEQTEHRVRMEH
jgi:hypothetical protein